ncbi:MAG: DNA photolyase FAD-binding protein [Alphaproteobacteria bacterium]|nr:MAG: DNA photolyase FAD-binding protein [Alphaproteobacteria bacterium]
MTTTQFLPGRSAGLDRLNAFVPRAGHGYATGRNTDPGPGADGAVSRLSPHVRYRLVTEAEVVAAVLARHSQAAAEKFVQEVLWRTYWKGWLELRPGVWTRFCEDRDRQRDSMPTTGALAAAEAGATGIDGFDDWARELVATGWLHNHARMWFASIWIFTLRLPWALGADFFLRHLVDADAASNTLSWRWVAGLQTPGKTYLATADNIARYTDGRYAPQGLAQEAVALVEPPVGSAAALPMPAAPDPRRASLLLVTPEDLHPESVIAGAAVVAGAVVVAGDDWLWGDTARGFVHASAAETAARIGAQFGCPVDVVSRIDAAALLAAARACGATQVVTPYAPVGPVADALAQFAPALAREGVTLATVRRSWDTLFWPHATKGFFPFRERIPALLRTAGFA